MKRMDLELFEKKLYNEVDYIKNLNIPPLIVLAPIFNNQNITDGYFQRIFTIDQIILADYYKIYIHLQEDYTADISINDFNINNIEPNRVEISMNPRCDKFIDYLADIFCLCKTIYIHTALRAIRRCSGDEIRKLISKYQLKVFWDVHGSVPEEFALHGDYWGSQEASEAEDYLMRVSDTIIVVTEAMKRHLKHKYHFSVCTKIIVLPIFNKSVYNSKFLESDKALKGSKLPAVIYAGGMQKWQKICEMQIAISTAKNMFRYYICIPQEIEFLKLWDHHHLKKPLFMEVKEKSPKELYELYRFCHYGFALRDDIIVNQVACPTKIIEYIQFGIVPILKSAAIGDFNKMGIKYVSLVDFMAGHYPNIKIRNHMAKQNFKILKRMNKLHYKGKQLVSKSLKQISKRCINLPSLQIKKTMGIVIENAGEYKHLEELLMRYKWLNVRYSVYVLAGFLEIENLARKIPIDHIYSYCGLQIGGKIYGRDKDELLDFCKKKKIKYIIIDQKKVCLNLKKDFKMLCHHIGL